MIDRSSRPRRSPRLLDPVAQERIMECRRRTGWGPRLVAGETGHPHSTVSKVLARHGISRVRRQPKEPTSPTNGPALATCCTWMSPATHGFTAFVERALAWFAGHGITARRLMTDNAFAYARNRSLRELLDLHDIKHLLTNPYRPQTNGKVERFHQTHATRMGLRHDLPLTPPPQQSPATLARPLQRTPTTQLNRRPTPDQPRSQPPWAGQLASRGPRRRKPWCNSRRGRPP